MAGGQDAQQVEEADQRNIPGHDDQHAARHGDRNGVGGEPCFEPVAAKHAVGDCGHGAADIRRREPAVGPAGTLRDLLRRGVAAEVGQPAAQGRKEFDCAFHGDKDSESRTAKRKTRLHFFA